MASKLKLTSDDYSKIDASVKPEGTEVYSVVAHKHRGQIRRSIHVFDRMPNEQELQKYESTASSVEFRGKNAKVKGSQVMAARLLYDQLIARSYDVPVGARIVDQMDAKMSQANVDPLVKRTAITELVGQVWGASAFDDDDDDVEVTTE